jgi:hypothetical protein
MELSQNKIPVDPAVPERLVECARKIAQSRRYPVLIHGLQPVEDYDSNGMRYMGLQSKYQREWTELNAILGEERIGLYRKIANLLYYAACIDSLSSPKRLGESHELYQRTLNTLAAPPYLIDPDEGEAVTAGVLVKGKLVGGKYPLRASLPYYADKETPEEQQHREAMESASMMEAINALSHPAQWPGWPFTEVAEIFNIPIQSLYSARDQNEFSCRQAGPRIWLANIEDPRFKQWNRKRRATRE